MAEAEPGVPRRPRVYLVRDGETNWNATGWLLSRTDQVLNARGEAQARELGERLVRIRFERAISSPLQRATRTAELILDRQVAPPTLETDDRLLEVDFGPYEGWSESALDADPVTVARHRDGAELPGIETDASVERRARAFFETLTSSTAPVLVVGHGRMLRILIATCVLGVPSTVARSLRMRNCRPAIVEPGPVPLLIGFNVGTIGDEGAH